MTQDHSKKLRCFLCLNFLVISLCVNASVLGSLPVTLQNNQSSATPSGFQQMITVNSSAYTAYENAGLKNVEFTTGSCGTGTVLQAWIESGNTNTSASTIYWVNLGTTVIPAGGSITVYMNFMSANVMSSTGGPIGEAGQLSATYGQNDNGGMVFNIYSNWAGTSLPAGWSVSMNSANYTVNDGLTLNGAGGSIFVYYHTSQSPIGYLVDSYFNTGTAATDGHDELMGWAQAPASNTTFKGGSAVGWWGWNNGVWAGLHQWEEVGATQNGSNTQPFGGTTTFYPVIVTASWQSAANNSGYYNYTNVQTNTGTIPDITYGAGYVPIAGFISSGGSLSLYWSRTRLYPPSGVMPTVSVGSMLCSVLPVTLLYFTCSPVNEAISLDWSTATETNNKEFTVQRSADALNFKTIVTLPGAGNSEYERQYEYIDKEPLTGDNYYRLTQVDDDGNTTIYDVTECNAGNENFVVYPNPSTGVFTITLPDDMLSAPDHIVVYNLLGQQVYNAYIFNTQTTKLDLNGLKPSVYILNVSNAGKTLTQKISITR